MPEIPPKRLIIRLSSLGDVVLATSALEALAPGENHWVVAAEYAGLLKGHPALARVWEFDRSRARGLFAWLSLCSLLWSEDFTEVLDLHNTWRSWAARGYFFIRGKLGGRSPQWRTLSKERVRLNGFFIAKRLWPKALRPRALVVRSALLAGGTGEERPDLSHLVLRSAEVSQELKNWMGENPDYLCVMPSSKWDGKKWSVAGYLHVLRLIRLPVVVLGGKGDRESVLLAKNLKEAGVVHLDGVGRLSYRELATLLGGARAYLGNDTGLAHLSEAVGTGVVSIFGPTVPEMGFGPWRAESRAVGVDLWCRPCGKDGRKCYRLNERYACQKKVSPARVVESVQAILSSGQASPVEARAQGGTGSGAEK